MTAKLMLPALFAVPMLLQAQPASTGLGIFENHGDVGTVLHPGSVQYDREKATYTVKGSGENMWFGTDAFEFVWKRVSGDVDLTADIQFPEKGGNAHRKGVLMIRQTLDTDSPYADVALHGDGLTSLQFREEKGGNTHEVQANLSAPKRVRIAKRGDNFFMWVLADGSDLQFAAGSPPVVLKPPFYVGIGVCSHEKDAVETAVFSNVELGAPQPKEPTLYSTLEVVAIGSSDRRALYATAGRIELPAWSADGQAITFNRGSRAEHVMLAGSETQPAATPEGSKSPSSLIYLHSDRSGTMQIWRTRIDGSEPEQLTTGDTGSCYPQLSPDGQSLSFLSFDKAAATCPVDQDVTLRVMSMADRKTKVVARFTGGRGTFGPSAWSPDSKRLTYVSYHVVR